MYIKKRNKTDYIIYIPTKTEEHEDLTAHDIDRRDRTNGAISMGSHYLVRRDGMIETGRELDQLGNRRRKYNHCSVFVDLVGMGDNFTKEQLLSLEELSEELKDLYPQATELDFT